MSAKIANVFTMAAAAAKVPGASGNDLQAENTKLKKENASLTKEVTSLRAENALLKKRKATSDVSQPVAKKAKTAGQRKKLFEKWAKACERNSKKHKIHNGCVEDDYYKVEVKETTPWGKADFDDIFGGKGGTTIQPTPENKPTSTITVIQFSDYQSIQNLFGEASISEANFEVQLWRQRSFCKSFKMCDASATLKKLEVEYNKSKQTLKLVFGLQTADDY
jgi:regulator of replication initiation timing